MRHHNEKPPQWEAQAPGLERSPSSPQPEKSPCRNADPTWPINKEIELFLKITNGHLASVPVSISVHLSLQSVKIYLILAPSLCSKYKQNKERNPNHSKHPLEMFRNRRVLSQMFPVELQVREDLWESCNPSSRWTQDMCELWMTCLIIQGTLQRKEVTGPQLTCKPVSWTFPTLESNSKLSNPFKSRGWEVINFQTFCLLTFYPLIN